MTSSIGMHKEAALSESRMCGDESKMLCSKYNSDIVSKASWVPVENSHIEQSNAFLTGSKLSGNENIIQLWKFHVKEDSNENISELPDMSVVMEYTHGQSVTDLKFIDNNNVAIADIQGTVTIYRLGDKGDQIILNKMRKWPKLHSPNVLSSPCSAVSNHSETPQELVAVGEDSLMFVLNVERDKPVRSIEKVDSTALLSVCHGQVNHVVTGSLAGLIKLWDLRSNSNKPTAIFANTECCGVTSLACNTLQSHIIFAGTTLGTLCLLDLRQTGQMHTQMKAHNTTVTGIVFHPFHNDHLLTSSSDGELWHWDASSLNSLITGSRSGNVWLESSGHTDDLTITSLLDRDGLAVNSMAVEREKVLACTDGGQLILLELPILS